MEGVTAVVSSHSENAQIELQTEVVFTDGQDFHPTLPLLVTGGVSPNPRSSCSSESG